MDLHLRKVIHPQAHEKYRVILKLDEGAFVIGSVGVQRGGAWSWGVDKIEFTAGSHLSYRFLRSSARRR